MVLYWTDNCYPSYMLSSTKLLLAVSFLLGWSSGWTASIPVYPGAILAKADKAACCDFLTGDSFDNVLSFYETEFRTEALDAETLTTRYPALKPAVDTAVKDISHQTRIRFFVLNKSTDNKTAELFEVRSTEQGVAFSIADSQMATKSSHSTDGFQNTKDSAETLTVQPASAFQLTAALPSSAPAGFVRGDLIEDVGGPQPTVTVQYSRIARKNHGDDSSAVRRDYLNITITDTVRDSDYAQNMKTPGRANEKAITVLGKFDGKESVEKNGYGCVESRKTFLVGDRYLVELRGREICDLAVLNEAISRMDFDKLN